MLKSIFNFLILTPLFMFTACGQNNNTTTKTTAMENVISKPENPYYSNTDTSKLVLTDEQWKKVLPPDLYAAVAEVLAWAYEIDGKTVPEPPKT